MTLRLPSDASFLPGLRVAAAPALLLAFAACANLSPIPSGTCGNKVVEDGEDCDGQANCYAAGNANQCLFQCEVDEDCLEGACGNDKVCRRPSSQFTVEEKNTAALTLAFAIGDLDADGYDDIVRESEEVSDVLFMNESARIDDAAFIEREADDAAALVADFTPTGGPTASDTLDVAFAVDLGFDLGSGLTIYRSQTDRSLEAAAYSSLDVGGENARSVVGQVVGNAAAKELLGFVQGGPGNSPFVGVDDQDKLIFLAIDRDPIVDSLAGLTTGQMFPDSDCDEVVYAEHQDSVTGADGRTVWIVEPCRTDGENETWRGSGQNANVQALTLPDGIFIADPDVFVDVEDGDDPNTFGLDMRSSLFVLDVTGDGLDDIVVAGAPDPNAYERQIFVAAQAPAAPSGFGPFVNINCSAFPPDVPMDIPCSNFGHPLAIADLNDDGNVDLVLERAVILSETVTIPDPMDPMNTIDVDLYVIAFSGFAWSTAVVADFDRDGALDVAGARLDRDDGPEGSEEAGLVTGIDVLRNAGGGVFTKATVPTARPAIRLQAGDFDGDFVDDLVYVEEEINVSGGLQNDVYVAFGQTSGGLAAPKKIGELPFVEQVTSGRVVGFDAADELVSISNRITAEGNDNLSIAIFAGTPSRQLVAPFLFNVLVQDEEDGSIFQLTSSIVGMAVGTFQADQGVQLAMATEPNIPAFLQPGGAGDIEVPEILWRLDVKGDAEIMSTPTPNQLLLANVFDCPECILAAFDHDGDGVDDLLAFDSVGNDTSERGRIRRFTSSASDGVSFEEQGVLKQAAEGTAFSSETIFNAINVPVIRDLDADGDLDIAIRVTAEATSEDLEDADELLVFFNEEGSLADPVSIAPPTLTFIDEGEEITEATYLSAFTFIQADTDPELELVIGVVSVDFDNDDLLLLDFDPFTGTWGTDPMGIRPVLPARDGPSFPVALASGDFDGDGVEDLAVGGIDSYAIVRGTPEQAGGGVDFLGDEEVGP